MRDPLDLERLLSSEAQRMDFFQILRLLENAHPDKPRIGASLRPRDDAVRFGQDASLAFEPTAVGGFAPAAGEARARLAVNFIGLLGANGPLPLHLTEYVRERVRNQGDRSMAAFLDLFHHRMVSLFYRARASAEPAISLDRPATSRYTDYAGSLFGIGTPALRERDEIGDFAKLHFAGLMANQRRPASGLVTILRAYFKVPVEIEQFTGHWMRIPPEGQTRIGREERGNRIGAGAVLGKRVWDCQHKFRLVIGPLHYEDYQRLLPGGASMKRLAAWVRNYAGTVLDWDVRLILEREQVPPLKIGTRELKPMKLGWTTYLAGGPPARDARQLLINP